MNGDPVSYARRRLADPWFRPESPGQWPWMTDLCGCRVDLDPDYIPEHIRAWASERRPLLERIVREFLVAGAWPELREMTRTLAAEGEPTPLREIFWPIPRSLGWIDHNPDRLRLTAFALRLTDAGRPLLEGLVAVLRIAVERYPLGADQAVVRQADVAEVAGEGLAAALGDVLYSRLVPHQLARLPGGRLVLPDRRDHRQLLEGRNRRRVSRDPCR